MTSPASSSKAARSASARCYAASIAILLGLGLPGSVYAGPVATPGPDRGASPAVVYIQAPAPGYATAPPPPVGALPPDAAPPMGAAPPGGGRPIGRAQFIEQRRQAAIKNGRDPARAAAHAAQMFDAADVNHDGFVDPAERAAFMAAHPELARSQQH